MSKSEIDEQKRRNRLVHGWVFRNLHPDEGAKIREFLRTGDDSILATVDWTVNSADTRKPKQ